MGRLSGLASTAIFVALVAVLIYFCCRVKRKGAVIQRTGLDFAGVGGVPGVQNAYSPHRHDPNQGQGPVYGPTTMTTSNGMSLAFSTSNGQPNPYSNPYNPSAHASANLLPYPLSGPNMPMPHTNHSQPLPSIHNEYVQQSSPYRPYPTASAPLPADDDLPPPYESVVRQS